MPRSIHLLLVPILTTATVAAAASAAGETLSPSPGVSLALATQRAAQIQDLRYELALSIPERRSAPVTGTNTLHFTLADPRRPLVIDFDPGGTHALRVTANAKEIAAKQVNGHIVIAPGVLRRGANAVRIDFTAGDAPLNRSDDLLYTLFVPAHARKALPCFDQPDLKGRWSVTVEHPAAWRAVANGAELERRELGTRARVRFAQTKPLATYLVSLTVGKFQVETAQRDGRTMRMFHRETDGARLARNREALFDLHAQSLAFMERYTGIQYQFGKFDFVLIPAFPFGGMEHSGDIHYRAESLLLEETATQRQLLSRARVIAHETAHMWFGDLVTMKWFDDVWTKEVFANFMASKIADPLFPALNHELQFFLDHHGDAYAVERSAGTYPIRQPLENLSAAGSLYGPIIYEKSPVVMRQLEALLGAEPFRDGLRGYLRRYAFGNATWDNLIDALAPRASTDLKTWSHAWIDEPGRALITTDMQMSDQGLPRLKLLQADPLGRDRLWPQQLRVTIGCNGQRKRVVVELIDAVADLTSKLGECVPQYVLAGGEGWGYGEFELDQRSMVYLLENLPHIDAPLTRTVAWSALWESLLAGNLAPERLYQSALTGLRSESDEQLVSAVLSDVRTLWWLFLSPEQRQERAPALEELLRARLAEAPSPSLKAAWFGALRSVATTPAAIAWLRALWQRQETIAGLPLRETDETAIAYELAVRGVADASEILEQQLARITDPDRRARFEFVRPALAPGAPVRERWFRQLADQANRRHEVWVAEGLRWLNHPLRAAPSAPLVAPALAMVLTVSRTGNLFFDTAWLAAVLSGHSSPAIAQVVQQFVAQLPPDYPPRLRALVLQRSDLLTRAARFKPS